MIIVLSDLDAAFVGDGSIIVTTATIMTATNAIGIAMSYITIDTKTFIIWLVV